MQHQELRKLLRRYAEGKCTKHEAKLLEDMMMRNPILGDWDWSSEEEKVLMGIRIRRSIGRKIDDTRKMRIKRLRFIGLAASLMLAVIGISWFLFEGRTLMSNAPLVISETAIQARGGVMLVLGDGRIVNLDSTDNGIVHDRDGILVKKLDDGRVTYEINDTGGRDIGEGENTIHTPNGKQFQLTLPDGTKVWMNTASTLTYPISFSSDERRIFLNGEAYFEVARDKSRPFTVVTENGTEILVTGTHFNVSAYDSENSVRTTLIEGGVTIKRQNHHVSITPGYEAIAYKDGSAIKRQKAKPEQVLAWKEGYFVFDNMDIVSVMRSVSRWYDIAIQVEGNLSEKKIGGTFPLAEDLDELLSDLSTLSGIKFRRQGKEVRIIW